MMIRHRTIHHFGVNVTDLQRAKDFYSKVLCLKEIERPNFSFPGAWFSIGDYGQQLHLIVHQGETLRQGGMDTRDGHVAIRVQSYEETLAWLDHCGVAYEARLHSIAGFPQIFLLDPDRNIIELNTD